MIMKNVLKYYFLEEGEGQKKIFFSAPPGEE
jgi:hypothetical protein